MSDQTTERPAARGMQLNELLALPVAIDLKTSNRALLLGRTTALDLIKRGEYPIRVMRVGGTYRIARADLLRALGIDPNDEGGAGPAQSDAA